MKLVTSHSGAHCLSIRTRARPAPILGFQSHARHDRVKVDVPARLHKVRIRVYPDGAIPPTKERPVAARTDIGHSCEPASKEWIAAEELSLLGYVRAGGNGCPSSSTHAPRWPNARRQCQVHRGTQADQLSRRRYGDGRRRGSLRDARHQDSRVSWVDEAWVTAVAMVSDPLGLTP